MQPKNDHADCWRHECYAGDEAHCPPRRAQLEKDALDAQGQWHMLELRTESSGKRHYLDGEPVHCGETIELQHTETRYDDDGDARMVYRQAGTPVRYECDLYSERPTVSLFAGVAGYSFGAAADGHMRFRWPPKGRTK